MHFCDDLIGICLASLECKLHEAETESSFISASLTSNTAGPGWMPINIHGRQGSSRRGEKEGGKERELFAKTAPVILPPLHFTLHLLQQELDLFPSYLSLGWPCVH